MSQKTYANIDVKGTATTDAFIKTGGLQTEFLKADGSVDSNAYITSAQLPSNLILYPTTVASDVGGYTKMVTSLTDPDYNTTAVDVTTGDITVVDQLIASLITAPNLLVGDPGIFELTVVGNIRKTIDSGSGQAVFYFNIYKRTSAGVETLLGTSNNTLPVSNGTYAEFSADAIWNDGIFASTDRIVFKFYGSRISGGSNPNYQFQFGGETPVRSIVPIPNSVIPPLYLRDLVDVEGTVASNNDGIFYNATTGLWEHKLSAVVRPLKTINSISIEGTGNVTISGGLTGSGTTNYIAKFTSGTALGNSQIVDNGTNVGIGKPSPTKLLDVNGDALINGITVGRGGGNIASNTANGYQALLYNTTGANNIATGYQTLYSNTIGANNTANGYRALYYNTNGANNTANGHQALYSNTTGTSSTANGYQTLMFNTTGRNNTASGYQALQWNTTGQYNTANGHQALYSNTTGNYNTANGRYALSFNTTGANNTASGLEAGVYIANKSTSATILNNSVMLGGRTSPLADNQTNQIVIGYDATGAGSNTATLGNTSITKTILRGNVETNGSSRVGDDVAAASAANVGAIRYRLNGNNSYAEMVMQTGAATYAWTTIVQHTW